MQHQLHVHFEERKQHDGKAFLKIFVALMELAEDAEWCEQCFDVCLVIRIISGISDQRTRKKLLAMDPSPSLQTVVSVCLNEDSALHSKEALINAK